MILGQSLYINLIFSATSFSVHLGGITINNNEAGRITVVTSIGIPHPGYNSFLHFDIGLIDLGGTHESEDGRFAPIALPKRGDRTEGEVTLTVSGWGKTSDGESYFQIFSNVLNSFCILASNVASNTLNYVGVRSITNADCASVYGWNFVIDSTLCTRGASNQGSCSVCYFR